MESSPPKRFSLLERSGCQTRVLSSSGARCPPARSARIKICSDSGLPNRSRMIPPIGSRTLKLSRDRFRKTADCRRSLQEFAIKPQRRGMPPFANLIPAKLGLKASLLPLRIRNLFARRRIAKSGEAAEFFPAPFGHEVAKAAVRDR